MPTTLRPRLRIGLNLLAEFVLVVIAVLLALAASQWADGRAQRKSADQALERIYYEIDNNKRVLEYVIDLHETTFTDFDAKMDTMMALDMRSATPEEIAAAGNISPFRPWSAAWRLAEANGDLPNIEYPVAIEVTGAYALQESYLQYGSSFFAVAFDLDYRDPERSDLARDAMAFSLFTLLDIERALLTEYDEALAAIEAHQRDGGVALAEQ